jgi:hypothetical protein
MVTDWLATIWLVTTRLVQESPSWYPKFLVFDHLLSKWPFEEGASTNTTDRPDGEGWLPQLAALLYRTAISWLDKSARPRAKEFLLARQWVSYQRGTHSKHSKTC